MCDASTKKRCSVEIVEQPQANVIRFRYECEGRSAGSILGARSTEEVKTYPSIRVLNYDGAGVVLVSCVTVDKYEQHPNCLVGKLCDKGVCKVPFTTTASAPTIIKFTQLGIRIAKIAHIANSLEERERLNIDPFKKGFAHKKKPKLLNLHQVRLCFQVILTPDQTYPSQIRIPLKPVVSDVIRDIHKTNKQLFIHDVSDNSSPPCGDKKIILLCDKVDRKDIRIRFYEMDEGENVVWEDWAQFQPKDVHCQTAITFRTPRYKVQDIERTVNVFIRLQTISGGTVSNAMAFEYAPDPTNIQRVFNTKKRKIDKDFLLNLTAEYNIERSSNLNRNIEPNEVGVENIAPDNSMPMNFFTSHNNPLPSQSQRYDNFYAQSQQEQQFQQQPDRHHFQPSQTSHCQWPSMSQALQPRHNNIQPQQVVCPKQFERPQREQYNQPQYLPMAQTEHQIEPNFGSLLPQFSQLNYPADVGGNAYEAQSNFSANNLNNFGRQSQPMANYQSQNVGPCPMTNGAPTHQSCQQVGPVHAYNQVIFQQFVNNDPSFHQQQSVADVQNVDECLSDLSLI